MRFPIGAEPIPPITCTARIPFWYLKNFSGRRKRFSQNLNLNPGSATAKWFQFAKILNLHQLLLPKWSVETAPTSTAILELPAVNWSAMNGDFKNPMLVLFLKFSTFFWLKSRFFYENIYFFAKFSSFTL